MADKAIFFDPSERRWVWIKRISALLAIVCVTVVTIFLMSLKTPILPGMPGITSALTKSIGRSIRLPSHRKVLQQYLLRRARERLLTQIQNDQRTNIARKAQPPVKTSSVVAAFYAPWQETGLHSLRANANRMTHVMPAWVHLQRDARGLDFHDWDNTLVPHNKDVLDIARSNNLNVVPVFSNAQQSDFDPTRVHVFLTDLELQQRIVAQLRNWLLANRFQGINIDFENMNAEDYGRYVDFLRRLKTSFAPAGLIVTADLEASKPMNWSAISSVCDFVIVMAYDEHSSIDTAGAIASMSWYRQTLQRATRSIPRDKLVVGLANYAYDWEEGRSWADPLTYQQALLLAQKYHPGETPEQIVDYDEEALNPTFLYADSDGKQHEVWMLDAITAANQWLVAQSYGVRGLGIWVLGSTDPSVWSFLHRERLNQRPNWGVLQRVSFPYDVEFVGEGEILHVDALPTDGSRSLEIDPTTGLALDEAYHKFPTSFVIGRTGYKTKTLALTIDDGPAEQYTGEILDALKKANVKATFFLIGENAERYPGLVKRIFNEGHEIGNHSFTHPNIGAISEARARLELSGTQRALQSILGRSTLLFRPPYNADAEPTSAEEVQPVVLASSLNYITVGEFLDPQDWNTHERMPDGTIHRHTAEEMLKSIDAQLGMEQGCSVLLHDGGGDRSETVRLIPMLIAEMTKRGYQFVTVSQLINSTRDQVMPPVNKSDTIMLANDRVVFETIYLLELFLGIAFVTAIILGTLRVVFVTTLALIEKYKERHDHFDDTFLPGVTVIIAAYNEVKVINRTIEAVLANQYHQLEILVIDDGSHDGTYEEVIRVYGEHPLVRVMRQENAGKAAALNRGIGHATGEIIIALDADTIFARDTIAKLLRHFTNPLVGAVAGNVKVGNRINPLTYWQAIEYITSQNLDRRAYSIINSVAVVPGAVGAWRREAIVQAGGYTTDTMAEDMDLTWRIRRIGWRIETESEAFGYTEAPDSFRNLFKQRFRWAFGTLQCLWKHRRAVGRYGWFGRVMLPTLWLFQIVFQTLSPLVDLQILIAIGSVIAAVTRGQTTQDWQPLPQALASLYLIGFMYAFFFVIELIGSLIAFKLDREDNRMLMWLFWQRFLYRQLMYAVLIKSIKTAASGIRAGWGKLERKGTVELVS